MKKQLFLMLLSGISIQIARAQCGVTSSTYNGTTTANYLPKFNNTTGCISNSQIQDNSTNVGIGLSPSYKLDVNGDINTPATGALRIAGNRILWNNNVSSNIYIGVGAVAGGGAAGSNNVMLGYNAGYYNNNSSGYSNIYAGSQAGYNFTAGVENTFLGAYAGYGAAA